MLQGNHRFIDQNKMLNFSGENSIDADLEILGNL